MMNAAAVLPAGAAMAFAGNAATISDTVVSDNSAPGGFSDMLGAMTAGNRQSAVNAADARTEGQTAVSGDMLSGLTELEQSAEELKQLLKTAELAGYMQAAVVQMTDNAPTADNAGLTQELADVEGMQSVVQTTVQNITDLTDAPSIVESPVQALQKSENLAEATGNDFAENAIVDEGVDIVSENNLNPKATDSGYNTGDGNSTISDRHSGETDIKRTAYNSDNSNNDVAIKPEENVAVSGSVDSAAKGTTEDIAANDASRAMDFNTVGKSDNIITDTKSDTEIQKDNITISYEKVTNEVKQEIAAEADNVPRVAYAKRNIEVKSEELKAITKGNEVTKSDSDLDTEQKVTDKSAVSDMNARETGVFARTESRFDDEAQPKQTVRVPISDMAGFVSEHAPKSTGKSTLTVVLTPETLGKITVRMVNESGKLTVEILTETQAAKELLQAKSEQLAYALKNDNVELASYKVEASQTELFQRDFDGSSKNPYRQQSHSQQKNDTDDFDSLLGEIQAMS